METLTKSSVDLALKTFTHGSEDSLDHDTFVVFEKIPTFHEAKDYCNKQVDDNANIIVIDKGYVTWCFKGIEDECNNSLLRTYALHKQTEPCPIVKAVERNVDLKVLRTIRCILSYFSRTELRVDVKKALKTDDLQLKIDTMDKLHLSTKTDYKKTNHIELFKVMAFQMGQTRALMEGEELFTKSEVAKRYPELEPYLYRRKISATLLDSFLLHFKKLVKEYSLKIENVEALLEYDKKSKWN